MSLVGIVILSVIVGIITAGLSIRFDRFFVMLLLLFVAGATIKDAVNIFLVVIFLGAVMILIEHKQDLKKMPAENRGKFLIVVPLLTAFFSFLGTWAFINASSAILIATFGTLTVFYGLRMTVIHFSDEEKNHVHGTALMQKFCGLAGPMISGFFVGFIGTSLKSLKIPFAVKFGKMNLGQVYIGNAITAAYASLFAILWRFALVGTDQMAFMLYGVVIWGLAHAISDMTVPLFPERWKKGFQILIGIALLVAAIRVFSLLGASVM